MMGSEKKTALLKRKKQIYESLLDLLPGNYVKMIPKLKTCIAMASDAFGATVKADFTKWFSQAIVTLSV